MIQGKAHPVFKWVWAGHTLWLLANVWVVHNRWAALSWFVLFGIFEYAAKLFNAPGYRETLSEHATLVDRLLVKSPTTERWWQGWRAIIMTPYCGHVGYLIYATLYSGLPGGPIDLAFSASTGATVGVGLYRHFTRPDLGG